jgi:dihydroneopterin triphosphate diphosphatase
MPYKLPISVLVLVHTADLRVLLLERTDFPEHWQSVTGSQEAGEALEQTARRELLEETGIDARRYALVDWHVCNRFEIFPQWRRRYAPGTTHNVEHVFALETPEPVAVRLAPREHRQFHWLPWQAAAEKVFSWSNREAILRLPRQRADAYAMHGDLSPLPTARTVPNNDNSKP